MIKIAFSGALKVKKIMEENPVDLHKWTPSPSGGKREWCFLDPSYFLVANISLLNAIFQLRPLISFHMKSSCRGAGWKSGIALHCGVIICSPKILHGGSMVLRVGKQQGDETERG